MSFDIPDLELRNYSENARGKVVVITGGAMGLGKRAGGEFIRAGAKVVIGDLNIAAAEATVEEWKASGGEAAAIKANVTSWSEQLALFKFAIETFGPVDIVVANAGVSEVGQFDQFGDTMKKEPAKPVLVTQDVNLTAVLYTAKLAMFYMNKNPSPSEKTLVIVGSIASIEALPMGPMYNHSKHGALGLSRSLSTQLHLSPHSNIRVCAVCPWFADTTILESDIRMVLRGLPWAPVPRIGGAIFRAATEPTPENEGEEGVNGSAYMIIDGGEVFCLRRSRVDPLGEASYAVLGERVAREARNPVGPPVALM